MQAAAYMEDMEDMVEEETGGKELKGFCGPPAKSPEEAAAKL